MIQILILLAMIPLALAGLRLVFALVKGVFGFIFFGVILLLMVKNLVGASARDATSSIFNDIQAAGSISNLVSRAVGNRKKSLRISV